MTLDELIEALGFKSDEDKDKIAVLKKEFNAKTKEVNTANKKLEALNEQVESAKAVTDKFEIVKKFFSLDTEAEDFDAMLDEVKDNLIKDAGGGATPEEIKNLKRELTKANQRKEAKSAVPLASSVARRVAVVHSSGISRGSGIASISPRSNCRCNFRLRK